MLLDYLKRGAETETSQENEVHEIDRVNMEINLTDVTQNKRIKITRKLAVHTSKQHKTKP